MFNGYETEELVEAHIKALLRQEQGLLDIGDDQGVKAVRKELAAFGYKARPPAKKAETRKGSD